MRARRGKMADAGISGGEADVGRNSEYLGGPVPRRKRKCQEHPKQEEEVPDKIYLQQRVYAELLDPRKEGSWPLLSLQQRQSAGNLRKAGKQRLIGGGPLDTLRKANFK